MQSFNHIQDPHTSAKSRRTRDFQPSPLDIYHVEEYKIPSVPKTPKPLEQQWLPFSFCSKIL